MVTNFEAVTKPTSQVSIATITHTYPFPPPDIGRAHRVPPVAGVNRGL